MGTSFQSMESKHETALTFILYRNKPENSN